MLWLNAPTVAGLAANMLAGWLVLFVVNLPASWLGLQFDGDSPDVALSPPGWLVVAVWIVLLPALGAARWLVVGAGAGQTPVPWLIVGLALLCAAYAYYTLLPARLTGVSPAVYGLAGNLVVIAAAGFVAWRAAAYSATAAVLVALVAIWTAFATISVAQLVARHA